jgi:predicted amidohydrolase
MRIRLALVQPARDRFDREKNLQTAERLLQSVRDVDIVCFPENWAGIVKLKEAELAEILSIFSQYARTGSYTLLTGSLIVEQTNYALALGHAIGPDGTLLGYTEKIFPSHAVGERALLRPGERLPVFTVGELRFGMTICVDLFYPELVRSLAQRDVSVLFNPSNIPENRISLWRSLVCVRAAENTIFVAFTNNTQSFYPDDRPVSGHSMVASPRGDLLFETNDTEGVYTVDIDIAQIAEARRRWPYLADSESMKEIDGERVVRKLN